MEFLAIENDARPLAFYTDHIALFDMDARHGMLAQTAPDARNQGLEQRERRLVDRHQLQPGGASCGLAPEQHLLECGDNQKGKTLRGLAFADQRNFDRLRRRWKIPSAHAENCGKQNQNSRKNMAQAIRQAKRIYLVPAIENGVGKARTPEKHAKDRPVDRRIAFRERNQLALNDVRFEVGTRERNDTLQRNERVARSPKVKRDEVCLAIGQNGDGRRLSPELPTVVEFRQGRLDRTVTAIDNQDPRPDARDRFKRHRNLADLFDLVVKHIGAPGAKGPDAGQHVAIAGRAGVRQERDSNHVSAPN